MCVPLGEPSLREHTMGQAAVVPISLLVYLFDGNRCVPAVRISSSYSSPGPCLIWPNTGGPPPHPSPGPAAATPPPLRPTAPLSPASADNSSPSAWMRWPAPWRRPAPHDPAAPFPTAGTALVPAEMAPTAPPDGPFRKSAGDGAEVGRVVGHQHQKVAIRVELMGDPPRGDHPYAVAVEQRLDHHLGPDCHLSELPSTGA